MDSKRTHEALADWFAALSRGDMETVIGSLSPDIEFELPADRFNRVVPYLGRHLGREAVQAAFGVRAETTEVIEYEVRDLRAEGDVAFAVVYTKAAQTRTRQEFEIEDAHRFVVDEEGRIARWKVYFDPNVEVGAFTADRQERLVEAAWAGAVATVRDLIEVESADVNRVDSASGLTPLLIAAGRGDEQLVRLLLEAGADPRTADARAGATALHKACQSGSVAVARALVEAGAFVDAVAPTTGHTPLMDALWYKYPDLVAYLLEQGAGLELYTHYGFSLRQHFEYELNVNTRGKELLLRAEELLEQRRKRDAEAVAEQQLMAAVVADDVEAVRALLASGAAVNARFPHLNGFNDGHTPLHVATRDGHQEITELLLAAGAELNAVEPCFGAVPLHKAVYNGHAEITADLVRQDGIDLDFQGATNGYTPLHDALWHGWEECARILLDAGARTDLIGHDGKTPYDVAADVLGSDHPLTARLAAAAKSA
ncbi:ankyrin repeat domain-containing protein [Kitasatospora sp. GAS1066B]|uniref:ankyrin repeat domain-containing protein n=1 Tax=Kitasatospora sp. GAS1066B TaxID=3156271 RepID=UPI00351194DA